MPKNGKALYYYAAKEGTRYVSCHANRIGGILLTKVEIDQTHSDCPSSPLRNHPTISVSYWKKSPALQVTRDFCTIARMHYNGYKLDLLDIFRDILQYADKKGVVIRQA